MSLFSAGAELLATAMGQTATVGSTTGRCLASRVEDSSWARYFRAPRGAPNQFWIVGLLEGDFSAAPSLHSSFAITTPTLTLRVVEPPITGVPGWAAVCMCSNESAAGIKHGA